MSTATCARFCTPIAGVGKTSASTKGITSPQIKAGSESHLTPVSSQQNKKKNPTASSTTNNANTEATFTFKLGSGTVGSDVRGDSCSVASSESSDPLESDYSEESDEEESQQQQKKQTQSTHVSASSRSSSSVTSTSVNNDTVDEDGKDDGHDTDDVTNNEDSDKSDNDDGNDTGDEETDDESEESNSIQTAKGVRKYHFDNFQIIKTVGTGTFGRVCLCRDRISEKYCAMKILAMTEVIRLKQIEHVKNERNILREIRHPFVISLEWSTKDESNLYMIFDYVCGGELFTYLRNAGKFTSQTSNFYAAEIVSALEYLHSLQIIYRDLKPENLLINRDGHIKITDFGFAKKLRDRTWTLCGTPEYIAPEIIQSKGHNKAVDWWALGVLIYEMLVGYPPFYDEQPFGIYEKILSGKIEWERHMDPIAKDLIKKLLVNDRTKRLGNMKNGADDVKRHRWFKNLNWNDVYNKKLKPPILPDVHHDGDTTNFDDYPETDWKPTTAIDQKDLQLFNDF
ncbi:cAMP-dependent protein kinase catalytic subunit 3 [Drosophila novamexicana]|uniref:cAMP-dependent protein kinase catalytic subunit 3 n=1 Tax=Drosophila novamexicana TaxID=47314 RepID=UPI0011E5A586|nr:cAMP-dependent protein kinase catalytic subunit 3 [Drosophila novamexicana]XP_030570507.1 cAMP-dependent protein kinase catalytic subunit 3 [Drosophila novamexicana]XP_030570508.1 cAMP-dependent protein kinase catalytic subunit 3 [Drosophila novamexicana]